MSEYVVAGGKTDQEGIYKHLIHLFRPGHTRGLNVSQRAAGANMSVDINVDSSSMAGALFQTASNVPYFGYMDATKNLAVPAADTVNARNDIVVAYVDLAAITATVTNNVGALKFKIVSGTPAATPADPTDADIQTSVGAGNPYRKLARIYLAANATSVVNDNLVDLRVPVSLAARLYGGTNNTNGHSIPNVADDVLALLAAVQTLTNKTLASPILSGPMSSADHIVLQAGTSRLVKTSVLRQDDTSNTYQRGNTVTLTGWGVIVAGGAVSALAETVNFGVTFSQRPIVTISFGGDHASSTTYGSGGPNIKIAVAQADQITTSGFTARINSKDGTNWATGNAIFYQWTATGEIA